MYICMQLKTQFIVNKYAQDFFFFALALWTKCQ